MKDFQTRFLFAGCVCIMLCPQQSMALIRPNHVSEEHANLTCGHKSLSYYKVEGFFCCFCPAGTYKFRDCEYQDPETTNCIPCPFNSTDPDAQTYMDKQNHATECKPALGATYCGRIMNSRRVNGEVDANAKCGCKDGFHPHGESIEYGCFPHSPCSPGFYPTHLGNSSHDTICGKCPSGTFSNTSSPKDQCIKFSSCPDGVILQPGDSDRDVVCNYTKFMPTVPSTVTSTAEIETTPLPPPTHPEQQTDLSHLQNTITGLSITIALLALILFSCSFWSGYRYKKLHQSSSLCKLLFPCCDKEPQRPNGDVSLSPKIDTSGHKSNGDSGQTKSVGGDSKLAVKVSDDKIPLMKYKDGERNDRPEQVPDGKKPPNGKKDAERNDPPKEVPDGKKPLTGNKGGEQNDPPKQVTRNENSQNDTAPSAPKEGGDEREEIDFIDEPGHKDLAALGDAAGNKNGDGHGQQQLPTQEMLGKQTKTVDRKGPEEEASLIGNKGDEQIDSSKQVDLSGNPQKLTTVLFVPKGGDERAEMDFIDQPGQKDLAGPSGDASVTAPKAPVISQADRFLPKFFFPAEITKLLDIPVTEGFIKELLKKSDLGKDMIKSLKDKPTEHLKKFLRENYLTTDADEVKISDAITNHPKDIGEVRFEWIRLVIEKEGRLLTAGSLLEKLKRFKESRVLYESAFDVFLKEAERGGNP